MVGWLDSTRISESRVHSNPFCHISNEFFLLHIVDRTGFFSVCLYENQYMMQSYLQIQNLQSYCFRIRFT